MPRDFRERIDGWHLKCIENGIATYQKARGVGHGNRFGGGHISYRVLSHL